MKSNGLLKIAVLTGAGISAESGINTFRDAGGLWEGYDVMEVASPSGWAQNRELVLDFYNQRRKQVKSAKPNKAHLSLVNLEQKYDVTVVTQNVDDLHERAGSTDVIHLHGELLKARSTLDPNLVYEWENDIVMGDKCEKGSQLRPHIVWFGEMVPMIEKAAAICSTADILIIIGTSMVVYPAAGLVNHAKHNSQIFVINPVIPEVPSYSNFEMIEQKATLGVPVLVERLLDDFG